MLPIDQTGVPVLDLGVNHVEHSSSILVIVLDLEVDDPVVDALLDDLWLLAHLKDIDSELLDERQLLRRVLDLPLLLGLRLNGTDQASGIY